MIGCDHLSGATSSIYLQIVRLSQIGTVLISNDLKTNQRKADAAASRLSSALDDRRCATLVTMPATASRRHRLGTAVANIQIAHRPTLDATQDCHRMLDSSMGTLSPLRPRPAAMKASSHVDQRRLRCRRVSPSEPSQKLAPESLLRTDVVALISSWIILKECSNPR